MKRETEEWIKIAEEDFQSAEYLFERSLFRMVCYHAQQTVEKILKAILTEHEIEFSRTHNIIDLRNTTKGIGYVVPLTDEEAIFLNSISIIKLAEMIIKLTNSKSKIVLKPLPADDPMQRQPDISLAEQVLKWETKTPLEEGLKKTVDYFRDMIETEKI